MSDRPPDAGRPPHSQEELQRIARAAVTGLPEIARADSVRNAAAQDGLVRYLELLLERNQVVNLVSRKDTLVHVERFVLECAFLGGVLVEDSKRLKVSDPRLLDLGSGGGFPGLVLKVLFPDLDVTLVEATQKKARFLAEACKELSLRGITVIAARAEVLANPKSTYFRPEFRHAFDWVTAKALGSLIDTARLATPFLRLEGVHWTFKGRGVKEETRAAGRVLKQLRLKTHRVDRIPGSPVSYVVSFRRLPQIDPKSRASKP